MSVTYEAVLDVSKDSVLFLSGLLDAERRRRGTRKDTRALGTYKQAVLVLRWFLDDTRMCQLARDNAISGSTAYDCRDEGIAVLAAASWACTGHCWRTRPPATPTSSWAAPSSPPTGSPPPVDPRFGQFSGAPVPHLLVPVMGAG